jgi:hypothetical protein
VDDAWLGHHDERLGVVVFDVPQERGRRADEIGLLEQGLLALGMRDDLGRRMLVLDG